MINLIVKDYKMKEEITYLNTTNNHGEPTSCLLILMFKMSETKIIFNNFQESYSLRVEVKMKGENKV